MARTLTIDNTALDTAILKHVHNYKSRGNTMQSRQTAKDLALFLPGRRERDTSWTWWRDQ